MLNRQILKNVAKISEVAGRQLETKSVAGCNPVKQAWSKAPSKTILEAVKSPGSIWNKCSENAFEKVFGKPPPSSAIREFSTYSRLENKTDGEPGSILEKLGGPESIADIGPSKVLKDTFEMYKRFRWKRVAEKSAGRELTNREGDQFRGELRQFAYNLYKDREICRFSQVDVVLKMLEDGLDGRFKPQCETRKCGDASLNQAYVEKMTKIYEALYGYPRTLPYRYHPIHAIATPDKYGGRKNKETDPYGNVAIFLKKSLLKDCATTMADDSPLHVRFGLDNEVAYLTAGTARLEEPNEDIWPLWLMKEDPTNPGTYKAKRWNPLDYKDKPAELPTQYEEVQIHPLLMKNLSLTLEYVGRMVIREPLKEDQKKLIRLIGMSKALGIKCDIGRNEDESRVLRETIPWLKKELSM